MPAAKKTPPRPSAKVAAGARAHDRRLARVMKSLETAQKDLTAISGSIGDGAGDLRRDVGKMLRDARRDVGKMRTAVQRDLARLQKDVKKAAKPKSGSRTAAKPKPKAKTKAKAKAKARTKATAKRRSAARSR